MPGFAYAASATLFVAWWLLTVAHQFRRGALTARARKRVPLGLIPAWTFFAPNPGVQDTRLIYRIELAHDWSPWREVHAGYGQAWRRWLFHPELVLNKAVVDLVNALLVVAPREGDDRSALLTSAYLTLLATTMSQPRPPDASALQFAVVRTAQGGAQRSADVVFVSEVHVLDQAADCVH